MKRVFNVSCEKESDEFIVYIFKKIWKGKPLTITVEELSAEPKQGDWRERFRYNGLVYCETCRPDLMEFISSEISKAVEAERAKIFSELREGYEKFNEWFEDRNKI